MALKCISLLVLTIWYNFIINDSERIMFFVQICLQVSRFTFFKKDFTMFENCLKCLICGERYCLLFKELVSRESKICFDPNFYQLEKVFLPENHICKLWRSNEAIIWQKLIYLYLNSYTIIWSLYLLLNS